MAAIFHPIGKGRILYILRPTYPMAARKATIIPTIAKYLR